MNLLYLLQVMNLAEILPPWLSFWLGVAVAGFKYKFGCVAIFVFEVSLCRIDSVSLFQKHTWCFIFHTPHTHPGSVRIISSKILSLDMNKTRDKGNEKHDVPYFISMVITGVHVWVVIHCLFGDRSVALAVIIVVLLDTICAVNPVVVRVAMVTLACVILQETRSISARGTLSVRVWGLSSTAGMHAFQYWIRPLRLIAHGEREREREREREKSAISVQCFFRNQPALNGIMWSNTVEFKFTKYIFIKINLLVDRFTFDLNYLHCLSTN